jgi:hypothetical protein
MSRQRVDNTPEDDDEIPTQSDRQVPESFGSEEQLRNSMRIHRLSFGAIIFAMLLLGAWIVSFHLFNELTDVNDRHRQAQAWGGTIAALHLSWSAFLVFGHAICLIDRGRAGGFLLPLLAITADVLLFVLGFSSSNAWIVFAILYYASAFCYSAYLIRAAGRYLFDHTRSVGVLARSAQVVALIVSAMAYFWAAESGVLNRNMKVAAMIASVTFFIAAVPQLCLLWSFGVHTGDRLFARPSDPS